MSYKHLTLLLSIIVFCTVFLTSALADPDAPVKMTQATVFTLNAPNGLIQSPVFPVLLLWNRMSGTVTYYVAIDGIRNCAVPAPKVSCAVAGLGLGLHTWDVTAVDANNHQTTSNLFWFFVGGPQPFPDRDVQNNFSTGDISDWKLDDFTLSPGSVTTPAELQSTGNGSAQFNDVRLGSSEGEISAQLKLQSSSAAAGVGFQADDGTRIYAIADAAKGELRIERRVKDFSIFDKTPKQSQSPQYVERKEDGWNIWEIAKVAATIQAWQNYDIKLDFSRLSKCVYAEIDPAVGGKSTTVQAVCDVDTPDHPALISLNGVCGFASATYRRLNGQANAWDTNSGSIDPKLLGSKFECRNLQCSLDADKNCSISITVCNSGNSRGAKIIIVSVSGQTVARQPIAMNPGQEANLSWNVPLIPGLHTIRVDDLSAAVEVP